MRKYRVGLIRGDGIGPEVVEAALVVLNELNLPLEYVELHAGYNYYKRTGKVIEDYFFDKVREVEAVLKGPLYTPWGSGTIRSINVLLRKELDLYANVRPFRSYRGVSLRNLNITIIRENTEGLYAGIEGRIRDTAISLKIVTSKGCERITKFAFDYALNRGFKRVTAVHKANIMKETDGLFREKFFEIARQYPSITSNEILVDAAAYHLVKNPEKFEVIVTLNMYGDILSDLVAGIVGSLGLCGSAQIGYQYAIFEPVHGVALDIAGKGVANPIGEIEAARMMLEYLAIKYGDQKLLRASKAIGLGIKKVIEEGNIVTPDLGGNAGTPDVAKEIAVKAKQYLESGH